VEEYTVNLLKHLFEMDSKNNYVLFFNSWKEIKSDISWINGYPNVTVRRFKIPNKLLNFFFWYLNWPKIDILTGGADIVFMPNIIFGSVSRKTKLIVTIHDLSYEHHPEYFSRKRRWWHIFINPKKICCRADKIIAVSDSTKRDIVSLYEIDPDKIVMIPSAVSSDFRVINRNDEKLIKVKEKYQLPYKFILFLGTIEPRKNITSLIKAFEALNKHARNNNQETILKYELVIAGESGWMNKKIFYEINHSEFKDKIRMVNFVESEDKPYLYNLASLFVYPSFFEGFGFPPLEAMRCGVPVICSNNSSLPEVAGSAAILIDPDKPNEIFEAMEEILTNQKLKEILVSKGIEKSKEFDWKETARKTLMVFR